MNILLRTMDAQTTRSYRQLAKTVRGNFRRANNIISVRYMQSVLEDLNSQKKTWKPFLGIQQLLQVDVAPDHPATRRGGISACHTGTARLNHTAVSNAAHHK